MRYPKGCRRFREREKPGDHQPWGYRCVIDVPAPEAANAKAVLLRLPVVWTLGETLIPALCKDAEGKLLEEVPSHARLSVLGQAHNAHEFRRLCVSALEEAGIERWLVG